MEHDMIMLDKHGDDDHFPDNWTYYRITSTAGLGIGEGELGATIQVCRLKWPALEDIPPVVDSIGLTGYANAYDAVNAVLSKQWNIDREQSIFVGVRDRFDKADLEELRRRGLIPTVSGISKVAESR
jgi:hypothetical protein